MRVKDIADWLSRAVPLDLAEDWDNVGLLLGDPAADVQHVMLCIDASPEVADEAAGAGARLLVAYHPPLFRPTKRLVAGDLAFTLLARGIAVYSPHTAFDAVSFGPNAGLAERLGLSAALPLKASRRDPSLGAGRIGMMSATRADLVARVRRALGLERLLVAGDLNGTVSKVAICAGSAGGLLDQVLASGADALVCGELSHHDALRAQREGLFVIAALHSHTERFALPALQARMTAELALTVTVSQRDRDPYVIF
jgi:dinuclear metal center YbgI/SA1388 family protein